MNETKTSLNEKCSFIEVSKFLTWSLIAAGEEDPAITTATTTTSAAAAAADTTMMMMIHQSAIQDDGDNARYHSRPLTTPCLWSRTPDSSSVTINARLHIKASLLPTDTDLSP